MLIEGNFGKRATLNVGDCVRFVNCHYGCHGIVLSIEERYRYGALAGQARVFSVGVPDDEEGWDVEPGVTLEDIVRVLGEDEKLLASGKAGKGLQFDDTKLSVRHPLP